VLDIELPDGRGSQLGEWMHRHELHRDVPVVVISGRVSASDTFEDPLLIAWLAKPFSRVDLVKAVRRALHKPGTPPTVLLADADETTRSLLSAQFREMGARCLEAACGRDALRHALQSPPDLLVLDADISDMDGFELVEQLRRTKTRSTPLIVYTGRDLYPQDRRRLRLGMSRYLTKSKHLTAELVSAAHETLQDLLPTPKLG